jgi:TonB family protein
MRIAVALIGFFGVFSAFCCQADDAVDNWQLPKLPKFAGSQTQSFYPSAAIRAGVEGRVLLAFDITNSGAIKNIVTLWSEDPFLAKAAEQFLAASHFQVSPDWAKTGALIRWRVGFIYCLAPSTQPADFGIPTDTIQVAAPRIAGAPVRTKVDPALPLTCRLTSR